LHFTSIYTYISSEPIHLLTYPTINVPLNPPTDWAIFHQNVNHKAIRRLAKDTLRYIRRGRSRKRQRCIWTEISLYQRHQRSMELYVPSQIFKAISISNSNSNSNSTKTHTNAKTKRSNLHHPPKHLPNVLNMAKLPPPQQRHTRPGHEHRHALSP